METLNFKKAVEAAHAKIRPYLYQTPLIKAYALSHRLDADIYLKLENTQLTHSFKIRGAFNKVLSLPPEERQRGVITASTGNHGAAVAFACQKMNIPAKIFVAHNTPDSKTQSIKQFGGELILSGADCGEAEQNARAYAAENQLTYISPYNDIDVICGQGTIGCEILSVMDDLDEIYISVGGGGLISGIAGYLKSVKKDVKAIACLPENSPVMYESVQAGKIVTFANKPTLSDSTAGNLDLDSVTFDFCKQYVDDYTLVSESEIAQAIKLFLTQEHMLVEGAAAVPLAALLKAKDKIQGKKIVIVVCGANITLERLKQVICDG